ncbi:MAG: DUF4127 family protein [Caldilineaceae bacterium]
MPSILILPLDDRPPNVEFPALLVQAAGYEPILPPKDWLGTPWRAGDVDRLTAWLTENAPRADALILALDTLGYGGLVNSRRSTDPADVVLRRLETVRAIKRNHPKLTVLGYSILMRVTRGNDAEEEKAYWGTYGARIFRISYLEDRLSMLAGDPAADEAELARLRSEIPADVMADYLEGRARNHAVNRAMIEWTAAGIFDYLIIPQDDTMAYGWNIAEARQLRWTARRLGVADRVSVYPGTDETDMLLIARYVAGQAGFRPRVWTRYSSVRAGSVITAYEDRPMEELIKAHLAPLGGVIEDDPAAADVRLYVNSPAEVQGNGFDQVAAEIAESAAKHFPAELRPAWDAYRRADGLRNSLREMHSVQRNVDEFARSLSLAVDEGHTCAVVDAAYVNGGDIELGEALRRHVDLAQLAGFGAGTLRQHVGDCPGAQCDPSFAAGQRGHARRRRRTCVSFCALRRRFSVPGHRPLAHRHRGPAQTRHPAPNDQPGRCRRGCGSNREPAAHPAAAELATDHFIGHTVRAGDTHFTIDDLTIRRVFLPWQRLFEIGIEIETRIGQIERSRRIQIPLINPLRSAQSAFYPSQRSIHPHPQGINHDKNSHRRSRRWRHRRHALESVRRVARSM